MATIDKNAFNALYNNSSGGAFPTNNTQFIGSVKLRDQALSLKDSVFFLIDDAYSGAKGLAPGINTIAGLKAIATVALTASGLYVLFRDSAAGNVLRVYELVTGTDAESSPGVIRPTDYAAVTNEKVWKLAVISATGAMPFGGLWAWPAGAFPTAALAGTLYIANGDHGVNGDPDYVPSGAWFISLIDGADAIAEYAIKL